jgi:HTH-type transcriptional regulator/antitoxin HigA
MEYKIPAEVMGQAEENGFGTDQIVMDSMIAALSQSALPTRDKNLPDPIDYLKEVMAQRGLRNCDLKGYIGSSGNVCSVLKRRKPLTLRMIRNLHKYLGISAEILIQDYDCHPSLRQR